VKGISIILLITVMAAAAAVGSAETGFRTAVITCGDTEITVEIADDPKSRNKGLMHREGLPEGTGMLLVYPKEIMCELWMRNVRFPLSAAFIKEGGRISQIIGMEKPGSAKIYRSKEKIKYALEAPIGWFERNGISEGDHCAIPELEAR
jgi:uncharacterized membrane protein (UPF0127 family)